MCTAGPSPCTPSRPTPGGHSRCSRPTSGATTSAATASKSPTSTATSMSSWSGTSPGMSCSTSALPILPAGPRSCRSTSGTSRKSTPGSQQVSHSGTTFSVWLVWGPISALPVLRRDTWACPVRRNQTLLKPPGGQLLADPSTITIQAQVATLLASPFPSLERVELQE